MLTLYAWDPGTDNGTTYRAPDVDAMPRGQVRLNASKHFLAPDGKMMPAGAITFEKA